MDDEDKKMLDETLPTRDIPEELPLPESPASANVKVWIDGFPVMFTTRNGKMDVVVKRIEFLLQKAKEKGWKNTWDKEAPTTAHPTLPACPKCGSPLKEAVSKTGIKYTKCSANKWNPMTKTSSGCTFVKWPEEVAGV